MGVVEQVTADQLLKIGALGDLLSQLAEQFVETQGLDRTAAMNPGADQAHQQHQGVGILVPADFADGKLQAMEDAVDPFGTEAGSRRFCESREDQGFDLAAFFGVDPLQTGGEIGGAVVVLIPSTGSQVAAQARVEQGAVQGGGGIAEKQTGEERKPEPVKFVVDIAGQPGDLHQGALFQRSSGIDGKGFLDPAGAGQVDLRGDCAGGRQPFKGGKPLPVDDRQDRFQIQVAVGEEIGIGWVIVVGVKLPQLFPAQIRDLRRFAARVVAIGGGRVKGGRQAPAEQRRRVGHGAFHLVVDHPFIFERRVGIFRIGEFQTMPFLAEIPFAEQGKEDGIKVDGEQIEEILAILAGEWIEGPVAGGHGIHEGVEAALEHREEWIAHREAPRAAEYGVFKNMGDAGGVVGGGAKADGEEAVRVVCRQVDHARSTLVMPQFDKGKIDFRKVRRPGDGKTMFLEADGPASVCHG